MDALPSQCPVEGETPSQMDSACLRSIRLQDRVARSVGDFGRLLSNEFRRHDPKDADRPPLARAARLAGAHLRLKLGEAAPVADEDAAGFLERFAAMSGARVRPLALDTPALLEGEGPIIAFREADDGPIVLLPGRFSGMVATDPATMRQAPLNGLKPAGFALHAVLPAGKLSYRSLIGFGLRPCAAGLLAVAACGVLQSLLGMLVPIAFGFVANTVVSTGNTALLLEVAGALLVVLLLQAALHLTSQLARTEAEGRAGVALHAAMIDRVLRLPAPALRQASTAILATQAESVDRFRRGVIEHVTTLVLATMHGLAAAALLCIYAPAAGLLAIACAAVLLGATVLAGWLQFRAIYEGERMDVVVLTFVYDLIRLIPALRAHRAERPAFVQWSQNFLAFQSRLMRSTRIGNVLGALQAAWDPLTLAACFAAVAFVGVGGAFSIGAAVAFVVSLGKLQAAGVEASRAITALARSMPTAKLSRSLLDQVVLPLSGGAPAPPLRGEVVLDRVRFAIDGRPVLDGITLRVEPGECVAICGPSGAGKSTLLRLLLGLEQPQSGLVLVDGLNLGALDQAGLSRQVGAVMQNGQLWAGTLLDNIRGGTALDIADAEALVAEVGLAEDLRAMPMGLHTIVGDGGAGLSRSQVQRVLLARALVGRPRILVLDEPGGGPLPVRPGLTRIVASHDPAVLAVADRVLCLAGGTLTPVRSHALQMETPC